MIAQLNGIPTIQGWSNRLISHLRLLISHTQPQDWEHGARPIVWLTVSETADIMGLSAGQVRRNQNSLMRLGAVAFRDSPNHRRFGERDDGRIIDAYGIDLSPLATLLPELTELAETHKREREEWCGLKHAIGAARRWTLAGLDHVLREQRIDDDAAELLFDEITALGKRPRNTEPLDEMRRRLAELEDLDAELTKLVDGGAEGQGREGVCND